MKKFALSLLLVLIMSTVVQAKTVVVPVEGDINGALANFVDEVLSGLGDDDTAVLKVDTYGGQIVAAEAIKDSIFATPARTVAVVDNKAESAGVLITMAAEKVYMVRGSTMGSAEPVPNSEKILSYWRSVLEDTASQRGRDPQAVAAMADADINIPGVVEKGKLLNVNGDKAKTLGLADGYVDNFDAALDSEHLRADETARMDTTDRFVNFISQQTVASTLLTLGILAFVVEMFMPGFGIGGILSIIFFALYFTGTLITGNSSWHAIAIFALGLILVVIEVMMPGFGLAGVSGIVAIFTGLFLSMPSVEAAVTSLSIALVLTILLVIFMVKRGMKSVLFSRLQLSHASTREGGYLSVDTPLIAIGDCAVTKTVMRPTGYIIFNGMQYEAISVDGYIEKNEAVEVYKVEGSKVFVRRSHV
ncbi:ATP-dependent Clp protease proteolytic subunit [Peptoniphilus equinus]|uniref:ATP-dependent Clp protease proteolytic subunit n=1 Tax=Peptoniphilus equinus TaxID=3016343 RepID=A0ABY7QUB8_9FIRM|nr:NfeD family protein [Peptoniphilus equinus]WBW50372.1 ATP-dependent Clp protease proteolytic subunit [Peptoniphilus equinus]